MNNLKEEELPPPGHVMTIIEALNKSNFLQMRDFSTVPSLGSDKTRGNDTSLITTRSTTSLSSSSYGESSFTDGVAGSIELEALYDHRYRPTCRSVPAKQTHVCDARYVCVCNKKKCEFLKNHKALTKSLNNLESSSSFQEPVGGNFRKYLTVARKIKSNSSNIIPSETKTLFPRSNKWNTIKAPIEKFQICENLSAQATLQSTYKPNKRVYAFHTSKKTVHSNKDIPKENGASFLAAETLNGIHPSNGNLDIPDTTIIINKQERIKLFWNDICKCMPLNPVRIFFVVFGILIFLTGVTFDHGLSHGVDSMLNTCWGWLREEYQTFGENFLEYQKYVFKNKEAVYKQSPPEVPFNSKFIYILENTEFSVQMNFFDMKESAFPQKKTVKVNDVGPLYFNIYFKSNKGFEVKYVASKSNITLSSKFEVFDVMKAILLSNQLPYFGFHIKDHYQTTPTAFLNVFIDSLNKFQVDTSFFSTLQSQIMGSAKEPRFKRSFPHYNLLETSQMGTREVNGNKVTKKKISNKGGIGIRTKRSLSDPGDIKESLKSLLDKFFLPLPLDIKKPVNFPVPTINRNLSLKYKESIIMSGLEGYQFAICEEEVKVPNKLSKVTDQNHPSNELFKPNSVKDGNLYRNPYSLHTKKGPQGTPFSNFSVPSNVISLNPILFELIGKVYFLGKNLDVYPFWVSSPHFISSQRSNRLNAYPNLIEGMNPREDRHGSFVYYHPILGVPINASLAFQVGVYPPEGMLYSHKLVPVMWVRFQVDKIPPSLWYLFWVSFYIRQIIILILVFSGLGMILCALRCPCRCGKKCDEQMMV